MEITSNIRFAYFKAHTSSGVGIVCMALNRPPKNSSSTTYRAGFSFCSPHEKGGFSKEKARRMAAGRIEKSVQDYRLEFEFGTTDCSQFNLTEAFEFGMIEMMTKNIPTWVRKAYERKQLFVGLTEKTSRMRVL